MTVRKTYETTLFLTHPIKMILSFHEITTWSNQDISYVSGLPLTYADDTVYLGLS